jgi:hypothetical protein
MSDNIKIQNFLFNWNRVDQKSQNIYNTLASNNINCTVINSSDREREGWVNLGDNCWLYGQTWESFKRFDERKYDYMNIIFGDIGCEDLLGLYKRTQEVLQNNQNIGIYSTEYGGKAWWTIDRTSVDGFEFTDKDLHSATICDYWYLTIHKDIAVYFREFLKRFKQKNPNFNLWRGAHGMGTILCLISHFQKKVICRDSKINMFHDNVTGWVENSEFHRQYDELIKEFKCFTNKTQDVDKLKNLIISRSNHQIKATLLDLWEQT